MKVKEIQMSLLLSILVVSAFSINIPSSGANPLAFTPAPTGGLFSTNHSIQLSEAHVEILVQPHKINDTTLHHNVRLYGNYSIFSPLSVNTTIAFAYPAVWAYHYYGNDPIVHDRELELVLNGSSIEYQTLDFYDLFDDYSLSLEDEYEWLQGEGAMLSFATFNISLLENTSLFLEVIGEIESTVRTDIFAFSYCVGTGRTWSGHTHETVQILVENYTLYDSIQFLPNESIIVSELDNNIMGYWNLNLTQFEENYVSVECTHYSWNWNTSGPPEDPFLVFWILSIGLIAMIAISIIIIQRFRVQ